MDDWGKMPDHLYNKQVLKLVLDRFGPRSPQSHVPDFNKTVQSNGIFTTPLTSQYLSCRTQTLQTQQARSTKSASSRAPEFSKTLSAQLRAQLGSSQAQKGCWMVRDDLSSGIQTVRPEKATPQRVRINSISGLVEPRRPMTNHQYEIESDRTKAIESRLSNTVPLNSKNGQTRTRSSQYSFIDNEIASPKPLRLSKQLIQKVRSFVNQDHRPRNQGARCNHSESECCDKNPQPHECSSQSDYFGDMRFEERELQAMIPQELRDVARKFSQPTGGDNKPSQRKNKSNCSRGKRDNLVGRAVRASKLTNEQTRDLVAASLKRAYRQQEQNHTKELRVKFGERQEENVSLYKEIRNDFEVKEHEMIHEPELYKYISKPDKFKQTIRDRFEKGVNDPIEQESFQLSQNSSVSLNFTGARTDYIKTYRQTDLNALRYKQDGQTQQQKVDAIVAEKKEKLQRLKQGNNLHRFKLALSRDERKGPAQCGQEARARFITGTNGFEILKEQKSRYQDKIVIDEMTQSEFTEYEMITRKPTKFELQREREDLRRDSSRLYHEEVPLPKKGQKITLANKMSIQNSNTIRNYSIFEEFDSKQKFFKLAKDNRQVFQNQDEIKYLQNCIKMNTTPVPAFSRTQGASIRKALISSHELRNMAQITHDPPTMQVRNNEQKEQNQKDQTQDFQQTHKKSLSKAITCRIGANMSSLQLFQYHLNEKIAKAMGQRLKDVEIAKDNGKEDQTREDKLVAQMVETLSPKEIRNEKIQVLMLDDNGLSDQGLAYILDGLYYQKGLESLNISQNEIGPKCISVLKQIFENQNSANHLTELRLSKIKFTNKYIFSSLLSDFNECPFIGILAIKFNSFNLSSPIDFPELTKFISNNKSLIDLNLQSCGLQPPHLQMITENLKTENPGLQVLNLSYNTIIHTEKFEEANKSIIQNLCDLIEDSQLQTLDVTNMGLSDHQMQDLIKYSAKSETLMVLHLSNNEVSDDKKTLMMSELGLNLDHTRMYNSIRQFMNVKVQPLLGMFDNIERQEIDLMNQMTLQEEVQKPRKVNQFLNFCEKDQLVIKNFVLQRYIGHPELTFESKFKNQINVQGLFQSSKWQILDSDSSTNLETQVPQNRSFINEKCPYTILFYNREHRETQFTKIKSAKTRKKVMQTFFLNKENFSYNNSDVLISGSLVQWDTVKMKTVERYGMQIDTTFYDQKREEQEKARKLRGRYRDGIQYTEEQKEKHGAVDIGPFSRQSDINKCQKQTMSQKQTPKYNKIYDDFERNVGFQDQLKRNLKMQEDMCFINTPDFYERKMIRSFIDIEELVATAIYVYADYNIRPGKYSVIIFDCADDTLWYKTVIVSLRKTHTIQPNITKQQIDLTKERFKDKCRLKLPKQEYFSDFTCRFETADPVIERHISAVIHQKALEEENKLKEEKLGSPRNNDDLCGEIALNQNPLIDHKKAVKIFMKYQGLFKFILMRFSKTSTFPCINLQDLCYVLQAFGLKLFKQSKVFNYFNELRAVEMEESKEDPPVQLPMVDLQKMQVVFFKSEPDMFECLVNLYWNTNNKNKNNHDPYARLEQAIKSVTIPRIGEILWDEFKDKSVWHVDDCQVMNIIFMNIEEVKLIYDHIKSRAEYNFQGDFIKAFQQIIQKYASTSAKNIFNKLSHIKLHQILQDSKLKFDATYVPGIHIESILKVKPYKLQEDEEIPNIAVHNIGFMDFVCFWIKMSMKLPTEQQYPGDQLRIGDRLLRNVDKIHRFIKWFQQTVSINHEIVVPELDSYKSDHEPKMAELTIEKQNSPVKVKTLASQQEQKIQQFKINRRITNKLSQLMLGTSPDNTAQNSARALITYTSSDAILDVQVEDTTHLVTPESNSSRDVEQLDDDFLAQENNLHYLVNKALQYQDFDYVYSDQTSDSEQEI